MTKVDTTSQRHDCGTTGVFQFFTQHHIVRAIGKDGKAVFHKNFAGFESRFVVGEERFFIANDLDLDEISQPRFTRQLAGQYRILDVITPGSIGQENVFLRVNVVEDGILALIQFDAADGQGHHFGARGVNGESSFLKRFIFSGADNQSRGKRLVANFQHGIFHYVSDFLLWGNNLIQNNCIKRG